MANNITVNIASGLTASLATNEVGGSHFQVFKMAYGNTASSTVVSSTTPLPVVLSAGVTANIVNFTTPIIVQGNSAGGPVTVQGTVSILGVSGAPIAITGGIPLSYTNSSIKVYGYDGNPFIRSALVTVGNTAIGVSGDALKVYIQDINITASINPVIYVQNYGSTSALRVEGLSGGVSQNVTVTGTAGINDTNILTGMTAIYGLMTTLNAALIAAGAARPAVFTAGRVSATTGVTYLLASGYTSGSGVNLKASSANTDLIYINSDGVASIGYELDPGQNVFLDVINLNKIYIRAKSSTQIISYMAS